MTTRGNPRPVVRHGLAMAIVASLLGLVASRLCQIALIDGDRLSAIARRQHQAREQIQPLRGAILDRSGDPLALSLGSDSIYVRPRHLPVGGDGEEVARTLGLSRQQWVRKISSQAPFVWLKRHVTPDELAAVRSHALPGVGTLPESRRFYPRGTLAATVVGFAGVDSQGLEGIERAYDEYLRGPESALGIERDALGRKILTTGLEPGPRRGADVVLTLDLALQYAAERELERKVAETRARGGLVVVLAPRTGEVLALAQNPSFDPNRLDGSRPGEWRNRAVTDAYEPGSTMKGLLAAAALEERVVRPGERFWCEEGKYRVGRHWINDHHKHGWLTFEEVLHVSSNICATKLGERLGAQRYGRFLAAFGFGARTGIDLVGEQAGILRPPAQWKPIDLATASFGQGVAVTPLQLAAAYAALANGGVMMRPYVVQRIVDEEGNVLVENQPTVVRRVVSEATARTVTSILEGVLTRKGTAAMAAIPGVRIAGKTGTSQKVDLVRGGYSSGRIASFVGYFPAGNPTLLMLVVVDEPRTSIWGGTVAAPVFHEVAIAAMERLGIERDDPGEGPAVTMAQTPGGRGERSPESFLGLSLREALAQARREGLTIDVAGHGYVVRQDPSPGRPLDPTQPVRLELNPGEPPLT